VTVGGADRPEPLSAYRVQVRLGPTTVLCPTPCLSPSGVISSSGPLALSYADLDAATLTPGDLFTLAGTSPGNAYRLVLIGSQSGNQSSERVINT
jgi:hypothetical protein